MSRTSTAVFDTPERDQASGEAPVTVTFDKGRLRNVERLTLAAAAELRDQLVAYLDAPRYWICSSCGSKENLSGATMAVGATHNCPN